HYRDRAPGHRIKHSEVRDCKSPSPARRVPVHPELICLGFLDFVERQRAAGQVRLFPELTVGKYGSASAQYSKRFGRLLRSIGITDKRKVLHSARHTVKDRLRAAQVPLDVQNAILGHATGSVGESYGIG